MNAFTRLFAVAGVSLLVCLTAMGQMAASHSIREKKAFVIEFAAPYTSIVVDIDADDFIDADNLTWAITPTTNFNRGKRKPIDPRTIRRGMEIEITGESGMEGKVATVIKLVTDPGQWKDEVNGYLESVEGDIAWIDGRRVKLAPGVRLKGEGKEMFTSFNEIPAGRHMDLSGRVMSDGVLEITGGTAKINNFGDSDVEMFKLARAGGLLPPIENLAGGKAIIAGRQVTFSNSFELQAYVTKVGNRLVPQYTRQYPDDYAGKLMWRFSVIEEESFNAFAMPDGAVFVHTGLLKQIKNEAQLAAVLGHEIAHATHEHGRKNYEKEFKTGLLMTVLSPFARAFAGNLGELAVALSRVGITSEYGRDREAQSDRVGVYYMTQAGYDPREAPRVWSGIAKENKRKSDLALQLAKAATGMAPPVSIPELAPSLFSSHPSARRRVKNLNRVIAQGYSDKDFRTLKVGEKEYMDVVGTYFGWVKGPAKPAAGPGMTGPGSIPLAQSAVPATNATALPGANSGGPLDAPAFVARRAIAGGTITKGVAMLIVRSGFHEHFFNAKTGAFVKKVKLTAAAYKTSGDYLEVGVSIANAAFQDVGQGGSLLLKRTGQTWVVLAEDEGAGYDCKEIASVPATVRTALNVECTDF